MKLLPSCFVFALLAAAPHPAQAAPPDDLRSSLTVGVKPTLMKPR